MGGRVRWPNCCEPKAPRTQPPSVAEGPSVTLRLRQPPFSIAASILGRYTCRATQSSSVSPSGKQTRRRPPGRAGWPPGAHPIRCVQRVFGIAYGPGSDLGTSSPPSLLIAHRAGRPHRPSVAHGSPTEILRFQQPTCGRIRRMSNMPPDGQKPVIMWKRPQKGRETELLWRGWALDAIPGDGRTVPHPESRRRPPTTTTTDGRDATP